MKKKTKRTLIVLLCIVVFIVAAGFAAYNIAIEYAQKKMVSSVVENMLDSGEMSVTDLYEMTETEDNAENEEIAPSQETEKEPSVTGNEGKKEEPSQAAKPQEPEESRAEAVDKFTEKLLNSISRKEKLAMVRLITSHLSGGDISYLASLLAGGLTREERLAAYKLAKQRFSPDELSAVRDYYHRYKAQIMIEPDLVPQK